MIRRIWQTWCWIVLIAVVVLVVFIVVEVIAGIEAGAMIAPLTAFFPLIP